VSLIYWDSMLFVYMLEAHPVFSSTVDALLDNMIRRGDTLCTSVFCAGEVLAGPRRLGVQSEIDAIKRFFASGTVMVLPFTLETADRFALIRASTRVNSADAIHLAAASETGVDLFVTNDQDLRKLSIPGIKFFADMEGRIF
jgi:predicted nucleic acid-binding protein